jgi:hypothetical protein
MTHLEQFIRLVVPGDSIKARLRTCLAEEAVVEPAHRGGYFCDD